jgi:hypothetical protein
MAPAALPLAGTTTLAPAALPLAGTTTLAPAALPPAGTTSLLGEGTAALRERSRDGARAADWGRRASAMERGNGDFFWRAAEGGRARGGGRVR